MLTFTKKELLELVKAWFLLSIAFTILFANPLEKGISSAIFLIFIISGITAGLGFILHELGHKLIAEKFRCKTEFKADNKMLMFAIILSFFGFIFAAPGAVYISGTISRAQNGKISIAGPLANLFLALAFLPAMLFASGIIQVIGNYGFAINAWLGLFNMIPIGNFDGHKIIKWSKPAFMVTAVILLGLSLITIL